MNFSSMKYVGLNGFGDPSVLIFQEGPIPKPKENEILMRVKATALNRADTLQRKGAYPPPKGASEIIGLEASGYPATPDGAYDETKPIMALLSGGGYAQYCTVVKEHTMEVPKNIPIDDAGGIPEAWLTAFQLLQIANIQEGDNVVVYAGASGVGTALIQMIKFFKAISIVTSTKDEKCEYVKKLGADYAINTTKADWQKEVLDITKTKGANVVLDPVGASFFDISTSILGTDSRWILYGTMSGAKVPTVDLRVLLGKRISLISTTLRTRSDDYKSKLVADFSKTVLPGFASGQFKVIIDQKVDIDWTDPTKVQEAHRTMDENKNTGKIILKLA